jgi:hypothetical protein
MRRGSSGSVVDVIYWPIAWVYVSSTEANIVYTMGLYETDLPNFLNVCISQCF